MMSALTRTPLYAIDFATLAGTTRRTGSCHRRRAPWLTTAVVPVKLDAQHHGNLVEFTRRPEYRLALTGESWLSVATDSVWARLMTDGRDIASGPAARRW